jgi:hypothetical protein
MSLKKAIEHKKEHRKEYTGAKSVATSCRNHKGCKWCEDNRTYQSRKQIQKANEEMATFTRWQDPTIEELQQRIDKVLDFINTWKDNKTELKVSMLDLLQIEDILRGEENE